MNYSSTLPPRGTVREWLDYHAEKRLMGFVISFLMALVILLGLRCAIMQKLHLALHT